MPQDQLIHDGRFIKLYERGDNLQYLATADAAMCIPLTDSGMVIFILEPVVTYDSAGMFLPGGMIENGEAHADAAVRELQEEIGYNADRINYLGELRPWPKYLRGSVHLYLARHLTPGSLPRDENYEINTQLVPLDDFERLVREGRLHDSTVVAALFMARRFLMNEHGT